MELFCSISVWASSLSARSRATPGWALWGLWAPGCPLFSCGPQGGAKAPSDPRAQDALPLGSAPWAAGGSFVSSGPSGLRLLDNRAASRLRGAGLPQCPPAGRRCKSETWGRSRRFLCPAEGWLEVHLGGLRGKELRVQSGGFSVRFALDDVEDEHWCSSVEVAVFLSLFLEKTVLSSSLVPGLIFRNWPCTCGFVSGLSILSWSPCVCVPASSSLWWSLQLRDVVWRGLGRCLQLCSSFSESFWPFKVLVNSSSLIWGIFLFLWKMPLNVILWLQSVYLLMTLVGMDLLIPHCSSAWAWNSFLCICVFFGFFISAF